MLDNDMKTMIERHSIGCVSSLGADGAPAVSPKATFLVLDDATIAFSHIRSPGTVANLERDPRTEIVFVDPFHRTGLRVRGAGSYRDLAQVAPAVSDRFQASWPDLFPLMHGVVTVKVEHAETVTSPSYDTGARADELAETWLQRFARNLGYSVRRDDA